MKKRQVHIYTDAELLDSFQRAFPQCLTKFVIKAIKLALNDKSFFNKVFFGD